MVPVFTKKVLAAGNVEEKSKRFKRVGVVRERGICFRILSTTAVVGGGKSNSKKKQGSRKVKPRKLCVQMKRALRQGKGK